jgi:DNA-binding LacI/PurR family transcriptional regulator
MALSVMQAACRKGMLIPRDLGVVGFDNISDSAYYWPPLTTIDQDQLALGRIAVEEAIRMIGVQWAGAPASFPTPVILAPTLIVRQSSLRPSS